MNKHEWDKIVKDAFSPSKPEPPFSERYRRQRRELERMVNMKPEKKRFNAGFWAIAVACCLVAVSPVAIHTMTQSKLTAPEQPSQINPASLADGENLAVSDMPDWNDNIPTYEVGFGWIPENMQVFEATVERTLGERYRVVFPELKSTLATEEIRNVTVSFTHSEELAESNNLDFAEAETLDSGYSVIPRYDVDENDDFIDGSLFHAYVDFNNGWGVDVEIQGLTEDEIKNLITCIYFRDGVREPDYQMGFNYIPENMELTQRIIVCTYDNQEYRVEIPLLKADENRFVAVQFIRSDAIEQLTENLDFSMFSLYDESTLPNGIQAFTYATTDENGELVDNFVTYTYLVFGDTGWGAEVFCNGLNYEETMNMMESVYFIPTESQPTEMISAEQDEAEQINDNTVQYRLLFDWLPDGMHYQDDGPYALKIHSDDPDDNRIITPRLFEVTDDTDVEFYASLCENFPVNDVHTLENGNRAVINCMPDFQDGDECIAFVQLENKHYDRHYAELYFRGLSIEEILKVMEGAFLMKGTDERYLDGVTVSAEKPVAEYDILENEEILSDEAEQIVDDMPTWAKVKASNDKYFQIENLRLCEIGETVDYYEQTIDAIDNFAPMTVCVDSVRVQSNFDGITTDGIGRPADFSKYLDENGEIWTIRTIDGISEKVRQYVVITELTFTNTGDTAVEDVNYNNYIYPEKDGTLLYSYQTYENGLCSDGGNHFSISADSELSKNNIKRIEAGQSVHVTCANMVDEDKFGHIYLKLNEIASSQKELLERPIIDLTNLKPEN